MMIILFFLYLLLKSTKSVVVTDKLFNKYGLANQIMYFQYFLMEVKQKHNNAKLLINGPKSGHLENSYGNHSFSDFFRKRSIQECESLIHPQNRTSICKGYCSLIKDAEDVHKGKIPKQAISISPPLQYCMPWPGRDLHSAKFCPEGSIPQLPFFFELFDFAPFIKNIGKKFLASHGLSFGKFTTVHFRVGDFKNRPWAKKKCYFTFEEVFKTANDTLSLMRMPSKIFFMVEHESDIPSGNLMLTKIWLADAMKELGLNAYIDSFDFIKLLVDLYIGSNAGLIIGNNMSTLSEILISYSYMNDKSLQYIVK